MKIKLPGSSIIVAVGGYAGMALREMTTRFYGEDEPRPEDWSFLVRTPKKNAVVMVELRTPILFVSVSLPALLLALSVWEYDTDSPIELMLAARTVSKKDYPNTQLPQGNQFDYRYTRIDCRFLEYMALRQQYCALSDMPFCHSATALLDCAKIDPEYANAINEFGAPT